MRNDADLLIVGASFAGVACAIAAARAGRTVVVIDKKADAGAKLHTTGIIVREAYDALREIGPVPDELWRTVAGARLYAPNLRSLRVDSPGYFFLATDTPNLMRWLIGQAQAAGVDVRLGTGLVDARRQDGGWNVDGVGRFRFLVGADGPTSRVARVAGLGVNHEFLFGVEDELTGVELAESDCMHCFIDRGHAPGYIGWLFVGVGIAQFGLAGRQRHDFKTPDIDGFRHRLAGVVDWSRARLSARRAGLIPVGGPVAPLAADRVLLVGDAAGLVSPLTAGGIHTAIESGRAAGLAVAAALQHDDGGAVVVRIDVPQFRFKRLLRTAFDHLQSDAAFNLLVGSGLLGGAARLVYFHHRGLLSSRAWRELLRRR